MSKKLIVKSNHAIEASYKLTLNEQRLILICVEKIKKGASVLASDRFEVSAIDFAEKFGISASRTYSELMKVADKLYERSVTIKQPDPEDPRIAATKTRWINSIDYIPQGGCIAISFSPKMIPYISMLEGGFTRYNLEHVAMMNSVYGIRFYEFFKCWLYGYNRNTKKLELDELKEKLELRGKYPAIKDFKLHVLDKAMADINQFSDIGGKYTTVKSGRKVSGFEFEFWVKQKKKAPQKKAGVVKIDKAYIEQHALPGESYEQAERRLKDKVKRGAIGIAEEQNEINI